MILAVGFLIRSTDIEGLATTFTYNPATGNPITSTSPYGHTTTFSYDGWQRLLKKTNYLEKETNYAYNKAFIPGLGLCFIKSVDYPEGADEKTYYNSYGWALQSRVLSLNDKWIEKRFLYDAIGRVLQESEPYFTTESPTQWNSYAFDHYGRPISQQLFTGKIISTSYSGLTVTVDDGTKTVKTIKNAAGNIETLEDNGGIINYQYYGNGSMKSANYGSHVVSTTIDGWGRKNSLTDPSAGTYTYEYNIIGEPTKETTPKGSTEYIYDDFGKLETKKIVGDLTDTNINYTYDGTTKLLKKITGIDATNNRTYTYDYYYDNYKRPNKIIENNGSAVFEKQIQYDPDYGRISQDVYKSTLNGVNSTVSVKNIYDPNSGILKELKDANTNNQLWKVNSENARGQALSVNLGNGIEMARQYDNYGFLTHIEDKKTAVQALKMDYDFDAQRGILNSRKNYGFSNWNESFTHDSLDRLTQISGAISETKAYDNRGRMTNNSTVGAYQYDSTAIYQLANVDLNDQGDLYYQQHKLQKVTYNAFKKPLKISQANKGRVNFEYGPLMNRTHAYYGGLQEDIQDRQYHKQYSSIMPVEMVHNNNDNSTKIITYIGGDAYTAPIAHIKKEIIGPGSINEYHYLHRDYLGSILAITDSSGAVKERRQFGAWGTTDQFVDSQGNTTFGHSSLINIGFTGHEHFFEVALIHMNGRMYDAQLGRFLSPDNYIQAPFSTQSYNRYGYVWNNPLVHVDPSGEFFWVAVIIGAYIGGVSAAIQGGDFGDILAGAIIGGIAGGIGAGVGSLVAGAFFSSAALSVNGFWAGAAVGASGGFTGGFIAGAGSAWMNGASFGSGIMSGLKAGAVGGLIGGVLGGIAGGIKASNSGRHFWSGNHKPLAGVNELSINSITPIDTNMSIEASELKPLKITSPTELELNSDFSNPTGLPMRGSDTQGAGHYGASRGARSHMGIDIQSVAGQEILSPVNGTAVNYRGSTTGYGMIDITPSGYENGISKIRILYANPVEGIPLGQTYQVVAGETVIGKAVNLLSTGYYPNALGMTNHIHVYTYSSNVIVDPTPFFFPR